MSSQWQRPQKPKLKTTVVNIRREPKNFDTYIGRAGLGFSGEFGTPFRLWRDGTRQECVEKFRGYFYRRLETDDAYRASIWALKGQRLGCFCRDLNTCHGTVIANYLNSFQD